MSDTNAQLAEILSAIGLLSSRIGGIEKRLGNVELRLDKIQLIVTEMAKKLLAAAECRALDILPPTAPTGASRDSPSQPLAAKNA